jgi:hypothetical protein
MCVNFIYGYIICVNDILINEFNCYNIGEDDYYIIILCSYLFVCAAGNG